MNFLYNIVPYEVEISTRHTSKNIMTILLQLKHIVIASAVITTEQ